MACECSCNDGKGVTLIYSCSGAANTGYLADRVWRALLDKENVSGTCLAAVGADLSGFTQSAMAADRNIVIDGCSVGCGKKIFRNRDIPFEQILMTDFEVKKGKTEITDDLVKRVTAEAALKIGNN